MTAGRSVGDDFYAGVLRQIGAPVTANNIGILRDWSTGENTSAAWNPLATTTQEPGSSWFNSFGSQGQYHVLNYPDQATGIDATARTLTNGYYPNILAALRANQPIGFWRGQPSIAAQLGVWGTGTGWLSHGGGGTGAVPEPGTGPTETALPPSPAGISWSGSQCVSLKDANANVISKVSWIPSIGPDWITGFSYWITQPCVQKRLALEAVAVGLIIAGLKLMGRPEPANIVMAAPRAAASAGARMAA